MIRGKVILVPFPFDDLSSNKVRPAVCLTDAIGAHRHIVVAFITSQIPAPLLDSDMILSANQREFALTGLRVSSALRLHRLMTITTGVIQRELGEISSDAQRTVREKLSRLFGN
jgi:mRNA interferase MazF